MNLVPGFIFLLCVLLLLVFFGDRMSAFHSRWFNALAESTADLWNVLCEEVDRGWCFVLEHLWWVLAVGSGGSGLILVAWMVVGGVADRATADLEKHSGRIHAGGILDGVPTIATASQVNSAIPASVTHVLTARIHQIPSSVSRTRILDRDLPETRSPNTATRAEHDFPRLPDFIGRGLSDDHDLQPVDRTSPDQIRGRLITLEPEQRRRPKHSTGRFSRWIEDDTSHDESPTQVSGITVASSTLKEEIRAALAKLDFSRRDMWRRSVYSLANGPGYLDPNPELTVVREATRDQLAAVESGVKIVPGNGVGHSDLDVEKRTVAGRRNNEFDIEISVTNRLRVRLSGLLIREKLPYQLQPVSIDQGGVFRNSTVTWVIHELPPANSRSVRVRVKTESPRTFATQTVISAIAAVKNELTVEPHRRSSFPPLRPNVQVTIGQVPRRVRLTEQIEVPFQIRNLGTVTVNEVKLRVALPAGLDHIQLSKNNVERNVAVTVRDLEPTDRCIRVLRLRATEPGDQTAVVELLADRRQADLTRFRIRVSNENAAGVQDRNSSWGGFRDSAPSRRR